MPSAALKIGQIFGEGTYFKLSNIRLFTTAT